MTEKSYSVRIRDIRDSLGLKISDFSRKLDIPRSTLVGWEEGKAVSIEILKSLEEKFNVNIDWFLTGNGEMFLSYLPAKIDSVVESEKSYKIPLLQQKVSCGQGEDWEVEQNIKEYIDVFSLIPRLRAERMYALSVQGTSMIGAGIKNGDYVLFNAENDQHIRDGIYVFALDGDVYCKRLEFDGISKKIKIFSIRVADLEKAELLKTLDIEEAGFVDRFRIFGRVVSWVHPNNE